MPGFDMGQMAKMANVTGPQRGSQRRSAGRFSAHSDIPSAPGAANIRAAINRARSQGDHQSAARQYWENGMMVVSARESGHNPNAQNNSDSNAAKGTPRRVRFSSSSRPSGLTTSRARRPICETQWPRPRRSSITPWAGTTFQLTGRISRRRFSRPTRGGRREGTDPAAGFCVGCRLPLSMAACHLRWRELADPPSVWQSYGF